MLCYVMLCYVTLCRDTITSRDLLAAGHHYLVILREDADAEMRGEEVQFKILCVHGTV